MPRNAFILSDPPPIYGMNTVDDAKLLKEGECVKLLNMFPGSPPIPRNGCSGYSGTLTDADDRFIPPAICFGFRGDATIYVVAWVYNSTTEKYDLCYFKGDTESAITSLGQAEVITPTMGMLSVFSNVYCFISKTLTSWKAAATALGNKVVESVAVVRDMCISANGNVKEITQAVDGGNLMDGECYSYAFQYVRHNGSSYFEAGGTPTGMILPPGITATYRPKRADTFLPGICIGNETSAERKTIEIAADNSKVTIDIDLIAEHAAGIAQGATHLRVSRTRAQTTVALASEATHFFLCDLPVGTSTTTFVDNVSDAAMSGETNQLITGYTEAPAAPFAKYLNGRMFVMDETGAGYFSESVGGDGGTDLELAQTYPQAWASLFKPTLYMIDCDKDDGIKATGIEYIENDIYFFKESKIFVVFNGDPTATALTTLSNEIGCVFRNSIVKFESKRYGQCIFFLSNRGPYIIVTGGRLVPFEEFKIAELWPLKSTELYGDLWTSAATYNWIQENCTAFFSNHTLWVSYKNYAGTGKTFGYHFDPNDERVTGPMQFQFATDGLSGSIAAEDKINDKTFLLGKLDKNTAESDVYPVSCYYGISGNKVYISGYLTEWTVVHTAAAAVVLRDICYGGGLYVVVGNGGYIATSPDWAVWTQRSGVSKSLERVTHLNGKFYAWTWDFWTGGVLIYSSADGATWTLLSTITGYPFGMTDMVYGNGVFLAVLRQTISGGGIGVIFKRSVDGGVTWTDTLTAESAGSSQKNTGILYDANYSVFYAGIGLKLYSSADAVSWALEYTSPSSEHAVTIGSGISDGMPPTAPDDSYTVFTFRGGGFASNGATALFMRDFGSGGYELTEGDVLLALPGSGVLTVMDFLKKGTRSDEDWLSKHSTGLSGYDIWSIVWNGEEYLLVTGKTDAWGNQYIATSADGVTWVTDTMAYPEYGRKLNKVIGMAAPLP